MKNIAKIKLLISQLFECSKSIPQSRVKTILDMIYCGYTYGASPNNYKNFEFYCCSREERSTFVTHKVSEILMKKLNNRADTTCLYDKFVFAQIFKDYYGRACFDTTKLQKEHLLPFVNSQMIYKPLRGGQGKGIQIFSISLNSLSDTIKQIQSLPQGVLESWINQHYLLSSLYSKAVNPIRLQTVYYNNKVDIICATLTLGMNDIAYANASSRALFALIDVNTGCITSDGYDYDGNIYIYHPDSHKQIKGFIIPFWTDVLNMIQEAAVKIPQIGYVGWDIAVTENGPIIIEGNNDPGYTAYQLPVLTGKHTGTLPLFQKYL